MNAPQRQIARITFERRHAPQNPLWNARPRSTAKENCGVSGWKEEWEAFRFKKKPCKAARRGRKIDKQPRDIDGAEFDSFLTNYFASLFLSPSFFFIVFSRLSRFCLLFYFLLYFFFFFLYFFLIWDWLAEALEWDLFSLFVITTATIVGLNAAVWGNWIFSVYLNK